MSKRELVLPNKFEKILKLNREISTEVDATLLKIGHILNDNDLFFFPEYTDHGIEHVQQVLDTASLIIPDKTYRELRANDIAVLVIAICLHDLAMHLNYDSFKAILDGKYNIYTVNDFDNKNWNLLWKEYLEEIKRYNSKQLSNILGKETLAYKAPDLNKPQELNLNDRLIIGEFIRRHHPRIAHEISIAGNIYGKHELSIKFDTDNTRSEYLRNIAGLIARSHGLNIRNTFSYLKKISPQDWSKPYGVNIVFLMVIIRIADYFQIQHDRSSLERVKLKRFISPVSDLEHRKHLSTLFINTHSMDNEALSVEVNPPDSKTFLSIRALLDDIQKELDMSWAVLGETYGSSNKFLIKYRRVISNIDFLESNNNFKFIPQKNHFFTSPDLPKLLISPLYSNEPTYGVRELLQNSIDACSEREDDERRSIKTYEPSIKVNIEKHNKSFKFIIEDNGKGMTLNEIKNYFLNIGSSLRNSREWKENHLECVGKLYFANGSDSL